MTKHSMVVILMVSACKGDVKPVDQIPSDARTGALVVTLGGDATVVGDDGEVDTSVDEVWVRFEDVEVHHESKGWIGLLDEREDIDLLTLRGGSAMALAHGQVYEGPYDMLRLVISDAWIVVDGTESDLTIADGLELPSDSDVTFNEPFFVDRGTKTTVFVGWDLDTQLANGSDGWSLGTDANLDVDMHE